MTWTYNQGIILSGLSGLYKFTGDEQLIIAAQKLIDSVIQSYLVPTNSGILVESCDPFRTCDQDQWGFKGIFFQHLGYFLEDVAETGNDALLNKYHQFIQINACAVWDIARQKDGKIGNWWDGPPREEIRRQVGVETHGSGIAAVLCAVKVGQLLGKADYPNVEAMNALEAVEISAGNIEKIRGMNLCIDKGKINFQRMRK